MGPAKLRVGVRSRCGKARSPPERENAKCGLPATKKALDAVIQLPEVTSSSYALRRDRNGMTMILSEDIMTFTFKSISSTIEVR